MHVISLQKRSIRDIEVDVENMGATINAYTSRESTAYYARCIGRDIKPAMDILGDMVMNSKLDSGAIARERDVILREAKEVWRHYEFGALRSCPPRTRQCLRHALCALNVMQSMDVFCAAQTRCSACASPSVYVNVNWGDCLLVD